MNLKDIIIRLDAEEVQRVMAIDMDGDTRDALLFIQEILSKKIKKALEAH